MVGIPFPIDTSFTDKQFWKKSPQLLHCRYFTLFLAPISTPPLGKHRSYFFLIMDVFSCMRLSMEGRNKEPLNFLIIFYFSELDENFLHFCSYKRKNYSAASWGGDSYEHSYILQITGLAWMWVISWWISPRPFLNTVRALILYALMSSSFPSGAPRTICPGAVSSLIRSHSVLISCAYLPSQPVEPNL